MNKNHLNRFTRGKVACKLKSLGYFLFVSVLFVQNSVGQTWTSVVNTRGDWSNNSTWDIANDITGFGGIPGHTAVIVDEDTVTFIGNFTFAQFVTVTVQSGGLLIISGDLTITQQATLTVEAGGGLIVDGDATFSASSTVDISGLAVIMGDFNYTMSFGPGSLSETGSLYVIGTTTSGGCTGTCTVSPGTEQELADDDPAFQQTINGELGTTLPVELMSFDGAFGNEGIVLNWTTASEINNDYFEIQKSPDGIAFSTISRVSGNGTTNQVQHYQYIDYEVYGNGLIYYRIKQFDFDGKNEIFPAISVAPSQTNDLFSISPNPIQEGYLQVHYRGTKLHTMAKLNIVDIQGKEVYSTLLDKNQFDWRIENLSTRLGKGIFLLFLNTGDRVHKTKLVIR